MVYPGCYEEKQIEKRPRQGEDKRMKKERRKKDKKKRQKNERDASF